MDLLIHWGLSTASVGGPHCDDSPESPNGPGSGRFVSPVVTTMWMAFQPLVVLFQPMVHTLAGLARLVKSTFKLL